MYSRSGVQPAVLSRKPASMAAKHAGNERRTNIEHPCRCPIVGCASAHRRYPVDPISIFGAIVSLGLGKRVCQAALKRRAALWQECERGIRSDLSRLGPSGGEDGA